ncbi:MAG: CBS domain-containing protein [Elusimicrobia bacterium]|nr:CBS domain-containing protein [Elusimicrobiota bacterium]
MNVMQRNVIKILDGMYLREVAQLFMENHISGAPVVDKEGDLVGIVSETDLVRSQREDSVERSVSYSFYRNPNGVPLPRGFHIEVPDIKRVREIMTPKVIVADENTSLQKLAGIMWRKRIHRIIITKAKKIKGIVSTLDILRVLAHSNGKKPA